MKSLTIISVQNYTADEDYASVLAELARQRVTAKIILHMHCGGINGVEVHTTRRVATKVLDIGLVACAQSGA